ncbi:hypothetical protein BCR33DRAFT_718890 [Rhizoclosmatium globosum]|uniref:Cyclic nucleotide-binding domain-containing protein n=1 Tax=Rhizoclosmatium globosum TaxID=329046 RepID=A0A1Y2C2G5_9FUNG|nr:hypothetical protein BCR33DRAFT_718890 [Rhizoclosmatium globosum]|eukprot:ORY41228.1 hypothetical protein BCR33DRAFT_718890 [Rhizoclosmatium globosum]
MEQVGVANTPRVDKGALLPHDTSETWFDHFRSFYLIPEGPFMANWDRWMVFLVIINCILLSFMAAFRQHTVAGYGGFWVVFPRDMAYNYIASPDFKYDVASNLFFLDLIALAYGVGTERSLYVLSLIRLVKMIRGVRIVSYFHKQEKKLHASFLVQILKFVSFLLTATHNFACIWFAIACPEGNGTTCNSPSWVETEELIRPKDLNIPNRPDIMTVPLTDLGFITQLPTTYCYSIYWTVTTMTTTGYGDIRPANDAERLFSMLTMTCGTFFFGYISGTIASALSNMDSRRVSYQQKMDAVRQYMSDRNMDADMQERVNKGIDVRNLFDDMPSTFKGEVALSLNNAIIDKAAIFKKCSNGFRRLIAIHMKLYLFTANEYVIHKDDLGTEMFFITQGRIDVYATQDLRRPTSSLIEGAYFGEFQIILDYRHEYSARCVCNTDIYVLRKEDLDFAFSCYPEDRDLVKQATEERYKQAQSAKKSRKAKTEEIDLEDEESIQQASPPAKDAKGRRQSLMPLGLFSKTQSKEALHSDHQMPATAPNSATRASLMQDIFKGRRSSNMNDIERQSGGSMSPTMKRLSTENQGLSSSNELKKTNLGPKDLTTVPEATTPQSVRHSVANSSVAGIPPHSRVPTGSEKPDLPSGSFMPGILRRTKSQKITAGQEEPSSVLSAGSVLESDSTHQNKPRALSLKGSQSKLFTPIKESDEPPVPVNNFSRKNSENTMKPPQPGPQLSSSTSNDTNTQPNVVHPGAAPQVSSQTTGAQNSLTQHTVQIEPTDVKPTNVVAATSENPLVALEKKEQGPRQSREDVSEKKPDIP